MVYGSVSGICYDLVCPFGKVWDDGEDLFDLRIGQKRRESEFGLCQLQLFFGSCPAPCRGFAEGTPFAGNIGTFAVVSQDGFRLQFIFCPLLQLRGRDGPCTDVLTSRLKDAHGYFLDVINGIVEFQGTERIQHHLRIIHCIHQNTESVFEVDDVEGIVRNDDAVSRT